MVEGRALAAGGGGPGPLPSSGPKLVPCLLLRKGRVCLPGPNGPIALRSPGGPPPDPFDVIDRLRPRYDRLYLVDLDGIERGDPQLEYMQELSRDIDLWVDAGVPTAEAAIDILVAGAQRAVLSSAHLRGPAELRRAWKLSTDWVFEVETAQGQLRPISERWGTTDPTGVAATARGVGISDVVVSSRNEDPDWSLVRLLAAGGPTWVDGSFTVDLQGRLQPSGAAGGIFHIDQVLGEFISVEAPSGPTASSESLRDDED